MKLFLIKFIFFSAAVGLLILALDFLLPEGYIHPFTWYSFLFTAVLTIFVFLITNSGLEKNHTRFMTGITGGIGLKLFASIIFIAIILANKPPQSSVFVINFFVIYFLFTAFEINYLIANLRDLKKK